MVDDIQINEEAGWERLQKKVWDRHHPSQKRLAIVFRILLIVLGALLVAGCTFGLYWLEHYTQPLTLPETVTVQSLVAADRDTLQASEFVQGLEGTGISVSFAENYDEKQLGNQEVALRFTRGREVCIQTAQLYRFHLEPSLTVKLGEETEVSVLDFVSDENVDAILVSPLTEGACGEFTLQLRCDNREYFVQCTVTEDIPPKASAQEADVEAGTMPDPSVFIKEVQDHTEVTVTYKEMPQFITTGKQTVRLVLTDFFGNTAEVDATVNVVPNANGPQFMGLTTIYLELGASVSYKTGVTVTDAQDGELTFSVDPGNFDSKVAGTYTVLYSATDSDGNQLIVPRTIVVESHIGQVVREKAQAVLDQIIKPNMTQDQKTYAVFKRVKNYVWYSGNSDKSSLENAAYEGFTKWAGDCYTYYAMVRVMLDMLEIPNVEVARVGGTSNHWWNLVEFEDGKYYHVDATPHRYTNMEHFKMTESVIVAYTNDPKIVNYRPNYYVYDKTLPEYQGLNIA